jgi:hypothetical protein
MRNVWIGLMIGAATGAAIGVSLDLGDSAGRASARAAEAAGKAVQEHGPELAAAVGSLAARGADRLKAVDLPAKARDLAARANDSDSMDSAREISHNLADGAREMGERIVGQAHDVVGAARARIDL